MVILLKRNSVQGVIENMMPKLSICIPAYNSSRTIRESIDSALSQKYPKELTEILVIDDCSSDNTADIAISMGCRVIINTKNLGIGGNLTKCMEEAKGRYVLYLSSDDIFADPHVAGDVVSVFDKKPEIGVIGRYYYQFMDGHRGAVMTIRENNILLSSINPSGMAFRKRPVTASNRIFIECPSMVAEYLKFTRWTQLEYDTVAVRLQPLQNTGCKSTYYTESPIQVLTDFYGKDFKYHLNLIQIKNRAPKLLWREICLTVKINKKNLYDIQFLCLATIAVLTPSFLLRRLSNFYRHRINRNQVSIIRRGSNV